MRLCVNIYVLLDNNLCLLLDNNICFRWDYVFCWTLPSVDMFYLIGILRSLTFNFHVVNRMLTIWESSVGAFLHLTLLWLYLWYYIMHIIISCTCWVPTISVLNLAIFLCCTNLLFKSWRRFGILRWGVLDKRLPPVDCLWSYVSFHCCIFKSVCFSLLYDIIR
jgi:hypothetical protein